MNPNYNMAEMFGARVRTIIGGKTELANLLHFARLFMSQLIAVSLLICLEHMVPHRRHPQYFIPLHSIHTVGNLNSKIMNMHDQSSSNEIACYNTLQSQ